MVSKIYPQLRTPASMLHSFVYTSSVRQKFSVVKYQLFVICFLNGAWWMENGVGTVIRPRRPPWVADYLLARKIDGYLHTCAILLAVLK